ncbi:hypothetical protein V6N13_108751 [Hibiscus sabdariffa]
MCALFWNVQGACSLGFRDHLRRIVRKYDPSLIALVETRVCGRCADFVIRHLGFDLSFHVEAHGFRGGIWILWKRSIDVRFLCLSNQYVHMEVLEHGQSSLVFVIAVYGSPNNTFRKFLWSQLEDLDPGPYKMWVLGGISMLFRMLMIGEEAFLAVMG